MTIHLSPGHTVTPTSVVFVGASPRSFAPVILRDWLAAEGEDEFSPDAIAALFLTLRLGHTACGRYTSGRPWFARLAARH